MAVARLGLAGQALWKARAKTNAIATAQMGHNPAMSATVGGLKRSAFSTTRAKPARLSPTVTLAG